MKKPLKIPKFKNEDAERDFWNKIDLTDYFDSSDLVPAAFPNLKPTSTAISLRIPEIMLVEVKQKANNIGVPYQALIKQYISNGLNTDYVREKEKSMPLKAFIRDRQAVLRNRGLWHL